MPNALRPAHKYGACRAACSLVIPLCHPLPDPVLFLGGAHGWGGPVLHVASRLDRTVIPVITNTSAWQTKLTGRDTGACGASALVQWHSTAAAAAAATHRFRCRVGQGLVPWQSLLQSQPLLRPGHPPGHSSGSVVTSCR